MRYQDDEAFAQSLDNQCALRTYRDAFHWPKAQPLKAYFCGHSLGLQPRATQQAVEAILSQWADYGTLGYIQGEHAFFEYHEHLLPAIANLVGAHVDEVNVMNTLTVNLHLMLVSFYQGQSARKKILIESHAFPTDRYALNAQIELNGGDPKRDLIEVPAQPDLLSTDAVIECIKQHQNELGLILLPGVHYYSGEVLDIAEIAGVARQFGIPLGIDLAHGIGNVMLNCHDWGIDFAIWCHYKYMNAGPGCPGGLFVHQRHLDKQQPRLAGWWGQDKATRMKMLPEFQAMPSAQGWQLSCPPILSMAPLKASLALFETVGMQALCEKSQYLTGYFRYLLQKRLPDIKIITPQAQARHGAQLSIELPHEGAKVVQQLLTKGFMCDFRQPHVMRVAAAPFYTHYTDVYAFVETLEQILGGQDATRQARTRTN